EPARSYSHLVERKLSTDRVIYPGGLGKLLSRALRQIGDIERGSEKHRSADAGCERFGHARLGEAKAALGNQTAIAWRQQIEERCGDATHARRKPADLRAHCETFAIQQPSSCALDQIGDFEEHFDLHLSRHVVVVLLD